MGGRLELRLNDAFDSEFDRKVMEQIPKDANGRGITGTRNSALLFQTALPRARGARRVRRRRRRSAT